MEDGRIVREDIVGSPLEEDIKMWEHSGLGRRVVEGDEQVLEELGISRKELKALQSLFEPEKS